VFFSCVSFAHNHTPTATTSLIFLLRSRYFTLANPDSCEAGGTNHSKAVRAIKSHTDLWRAATALIREVAPDYAFSGIVFAMNFAGSPHTDRHDIAPQFVMSCGPFSQGGDLCVETPSGDGVWAVCTRDRVACVDGRFPHWVTAYEGTRWSVVWYRTVGAPVPKGETSVFPNPPVCVDGSSGGGSGSCSGSGGSGAGGSGDGDARE
jgi:hypothetical protein